MRQLLNFIRNTLGLLHSLCIMALLFSASAAFIPPSAFWPVSFAGLLFFPLYVLNLTLLPIWIWRKKWFALIPLLAALLTSPLFPRSWQWPANTRETGKVKLMNWNVKLFDLYEWSGDSETRARMFALIQIENPDILCLQEFFNRPGREDFLNYIRDTLGYPHACFQPAVQKEYTRGGKKWVAEYGVAIFSRYPITRCGAFPLAHRKYANCTFADIQAGNQTARIFTTHLQSVHLDDLDYAHLEDLEQRQSMHWMHIGAILRKLKRAWIYRETQTQQVKNAIDSTSGPVILCGDFNDVPVSHTYHELAAGMQDAFVAAGGDLGATLFGKFSLFRIDYALLSEHFQVRSCRVVREKLSDHYPVVVTFDWK